MVPVVVACVDWWELVSLHWSLHWTWDWFHNTLYTLTFYYKTTVQISFVWKKLNTILKKENKGSLEKSVWKITKSMVKSKGIFVLWPINFCLLQFCILQFWDNAQILVFTIASYFLLLENFCGQRGYLWLLLLFFIISNSYCYEYDKSSLFWY